MSEIWAVILAAGESKRMGTPKMLLPFNGSTMIRNVIQNVSESDISKIMVVLGAHKEKISMEIEKLPVRTCFNDDFSQGMLTSVKCGVRNLPSGFDAVLVFQGDQPLIRPATINKIINSYTSSNKSLAIPVYKNRRGHPLLVDKKYTIDIEKISPDKGLNTLAEQYSHDVLEVETDDPGILRDFDTYEEYLKEINKIK